MPHTGDGCFGFDENDQLGILIHIYPNGHTQFGIGWDCDSAGPAYSEVEEGQQKNYLMMVKLVTREQGPTLQIVSVTEN